MQYLLYILCEKFNAPCNCYLLLLKSQIEVRNVPARTRLKMQGDNRNDVAFLSCTIHGRHFVRTCCGTVTMPCPRFINDRGSKVDAKLARCSSCNLSRINQRSGERFMHSHPLRANVIPRGATARGAACHKSLCNFFSHCSGLGINLTLKTLR